MTADYLKLSEAPTLIFATPYCSACTMDYEDTGDEWLCPTCGTTWDFEDFDQQGTLYEEWSGETLPGKPVDNLDAWRIAAAKRAGRQR